LSQTNSVVRKQVIIAITGIYYRRGVFAVRYSLDPISCISVGATYERYVLGIPVV